MIRSGVSSLAVLFVFLAVTACSSSPGSPSTGKPTPSASVVPSSVRIGKLTETFATPLPSGATDIEVVDGFREGIVLYDKSQVDFRLVAPVTAYVTGSMLKSLQSTTASFKKGDYVPAGTDRFFKTTVVSATSQQAQITTCDDASKETEVNAATGAVDPSFENLPLDEQYLFETWKMTPLGGHWAIAEVSFAKPTSASAKQCQP